MTSYKEMSLGFQVPIWVLFDYKCPVQKTKMFISYLLHFDLLVYHLSFSLIRLPLWSKIHGCPLSTKTYPWAKYQGLSPGQLPKLVHRPPTKTSPQATHWNLHRGQIPRLIHSPHTQVCPKITLQGLTTGHHPRLVQCPWTNPSPQLMYQGLFTGHQPKLIFPWLVYNPSTKACLSKACSLVPIYLLNDTRQLST